MLPRTLAGATVLQIVAALRETPQVRTAISAARALVQVGAHQRFAGPNSAPGQRIAIGRARDRSSACIARARFSASGTSTGGVGAGAGCPRGTASAA